MKLPFPEDEPGHLFSVLTDMNRWPEEISSQIGSDIMSAFFTYNPKERSSSSLCPDGLYLSNPNGSGDLCYINSDPACYAMLQTLMPRLMSACHNKKFAVIESISRTGSNNLLCNLHIQDNVFCFSERVGFSCVDFWDCFGRKPEDRDEIFSEVLASKTWIWKNDSQNPFVNCNPFITGYLDASVIFHFRHPYLTALSWKSFF